MIIYKITNTVNGKVYIGQTAQTLEKRFYQHCRVYEAIRTSIITKAIKKYGKENFLIEQIDFAENDEELDKKEKYWINFYDSYNISKGYNLSPGGLDGTRKYIKKKKAHLSVLQGALEKVNYEILFITRRNREILEGELKEYLQNAIFNALKKEKWEGTIVNKLIIGSNYCNISVNIEVNNLPHKLIYDLKRETYTALSKKYPKIIGKTALWTHSYLISMGEIPEEIKIGYTEFHKENYSFRKNIKKLSLEK